MVKRQTPELNKLLKRVRRLTKADGSKPKLADRLGFHVGLIYDWLAGRNEPGGEVTLQMLKWAEAEEGKPKKDAGRVTSTPAKARKIANQTNEKPTPRPREK